MNTFALIERYITSAIDTVFVAESKTRILENGQRYIDVNFKEAGYVKIMSLLMDGLSDYYRANGPEGDAGYTNYHTSEATRDGYKVGMLTALGNYSNYNMIVVDNSKSIVQTMKKQLA